MDENDTIDALQAGHSHATENQIYGLSPEALPGAAEDIIHLFLQANRLVATLSPAIQTIVRDAVQVAMDSRTPDILTEHFNHTPTNAADWDQKCSKAENEGKLNQLHKVYMLPIPVEEDEQPTGFDEHLLHMIGQLPCYFPLESFSQGASIVNEGLDPTLFPVARGDDEMKTYGDLLPVMEDPHVNQKSQRNPGGKQKGNPQEYTVARTLPPRMQEVSLTPGSSKITQTPTLTNAQTQIALNNEEVHSDYSAWGVVIHIPLEGVAPSFPEH
ncbi:hypothetical protein BKA82DRAFT_4021808 [Pisolithus tinctorius]|nr:hypothetical protein BKA82DRAFT_4021808 [Pisolithus tinctorius]